VRRYLLDTGIMSDLMNDRCGVRDRVKAAWRRGDRIGTCWPVVGELWYGLERSSSWERNLPILLRTLNEVLKWPFEDEAAKQFGRLHHELRRVGRVMQIVDMQLAAIAFALGNCTVVTKDGDLSAVPGLQVENWATP
jgi:tRNA(fMet)-specific endonuclease VapC